MPDPSTLTVRLPRRLIVSAGTILLAFALLAVPAFALKGDGKNGGKDDDKPPPPLAEKTAGLEKRAGFVDFWVDEVRGKVWLEIPPPEGQRGVAMELLYVHGLLQGLGSNPVGLDRGQISGGQVIEVRRVGPRVLFEEPNLGFRALTDDAEEREATRQSFASSVIWGTKVGALDPDGRALVDLTPFLVRDAHSVVSTLEETGQGAFELDPERSAVDFSNCLAFPDNVELEAILTYAGQNPGRHVRDTAPTPRAVTLTAHHSFIRLPDDGYSPRPLDPRVGVFGIEFLDYAVPLTEEMRTQWISRHRLEKKDPSAERSEAVEPIVYYVDRGAPEPIRSALVEGASWWTEAFEAAGFIDGFRVEILPEGAHPLDVRYNVIQWVHRSTRGWSYGGGVIDPRTGEFIKGHVTLGSLRVRQDRRIFEGLAGVSKTGTGEPDDPVEIALSRIRQLSAHEVGHTLGLTHNFAASTYGGRASVMDYPAPLVDVTGSGELDFSRAYGVGLGAWDVDTIRYAYTDFPEGEDESGLAEIVEELITKHVFVADKHARPPSAADPRGNLWDNGDEAVAALAKILEVRRIALENFGEDNLPMGRPLAELEEVLAPIYFFHRYQLDAAVKTLGGLETDYAVRGDGQAAPRIVPAERQRAGLEAVLSILDPAVLDLPEEVLDVLPPRPFEMSRNRELFASETSPVFDALGAAETAAAEVVDALLVPERLGRVQDFHRRDPDLPSVGEVLDRLVEVAFSGGPGVSPRHAAVRQAIERVTIGRLISAASHPHLDPGLRAEIDWKLRETGRGLAAMSQAAPRNAAAHLAGLADDIERYLDRDVTTSGEIAPPADPPPGSPIGMGHLSGCGFVGGFF